MISCEDFLDKGPLDKLSEAAYWERASDAEYAVNGLYECFYELDGGGYWSPGGAPYLDVCTDLIYLRNSWEFGLMPFSDGSMNSDNGWIYAFWSKKYQYIRYANYFFENVDKVKNLMTDDEYKNLCGQARVVRAFCYLRLVQGYGDVPLVKETLGTDALPSRTPATEVMDFVLSELKLAADELPETQSDDAHGRIFKHVANAYAARAALHYAGYYGKTEHYQTAVDALSQIVGSGQFELYEKNSDLVNNFNEIFWAANEGKENKEIIFSDQFIADKRPNNISTCFAGTGWKALQATQACIDLFECTDGWQANGIQFADMNKYRNTKNLSSPLLGKSAKYDPLNEFTNRDPRLTATFFHPTISTTGGTISRTGEFWEPANATFSPDRDNDAYSFKKLVDPTNFNPVYYYGNSENNFPLIRYSDMLLLYAEALNEAGISDPLGKTPLFYVNAVRDRVGMPAIVSSDPSEIREIIKHERKVELLAENVLMWDYMRWKDYEKTMPNGSAFYGYRRETYGQESVLFQTKLKTYPKYNLWPIPTAEMRNNKNMKQNTGW